MHRLLLLGAAAAAAAAADGAAAAAAPRRGGGGGGGGGSGGSGGSVSCPRPLFLPRSHAVAAAAAPAACRSKGARVINTSFVLTEFNLALRDAIGNGTAAGVFFAG